MKNLIPQLLILMTLCLVFNNDVSAQYGTTRLGLQSGSTGDHNSFFGFQTGMNAPTGGSNTFVGSQAGKNNSTGFSNTFMGRLAGERNTIGNSNTFIGRFAGRLNTTGTTNAFVGSDSGQQNTTGSYNTFFGASTGIDNTTGEYNTFIGTYAGNANTTGIKNAYLGYSTGFSNVTGSNNVSIGYYAGYNEIGSNKLHIANTDTKSLIYGKFDTDQVAIGTTDNYIPTGFTLAVGGKMIAEEVKVRLRNAWPDYVFEKNYNKPTLEELEVSIVENGHLPNIPSAATVEAEGYL